MRVRLALAGYTGRMGKAIADVLAEDDSRAVLGGGLVRAMVPKAESLFETCDVVVDFTSPSLTLELVEKAARLHKPYLCGTTGLDEKTMAGLKRFGESIPVLYAANTSLSLVVARRMAGLAAQLLAPYPYDIAILDRHHRWKKDSPSGTALSLGRAVEEGNHGAHKVSYASIHAGAIVGEHEVLFAGDGTSITLTHTVTDRHVFARGAVTAALWLASQKSGFYSMDDVLSV
ncbi:MAG: 4-hydroxy-tetrahydrodipicolinate reductase [Alphaproteobacteria bacterium]|nr:4-hydroxy-tetrahydrodipicolinate reductase [Alphaproteobacteria bacterium]